MSIVDMVRNMFEKAQRETRNNAAMAALMCCVNLLWQCFAEIIGFISKFAIVCAAISRDAFCDSARKVTIFTKQHVINLCGVVVASDDSQDDCVYRLGRFGVVFGLSSSNYLTTNREAPR